VNLSRSYQALLTRVFGPLEIEYDPKASPTLDFAHLPLDTKPIHIHPANGRPLPTQQDIPAGSHNPKIISPYYLDSTRFG
jgi:hypothetical protein